MKKCVIDIVVAVAMSLSAFASPLALPAKAAIKGGEKVAAKFGLRTAEKCTVRGGAKLAAVTAGRETAKRTTGAAIENGVRRVTAAQLLAAGGGTAMVVAAHECADGVQQMGEGVREAVIANPDLAGEVADSVTAPLRYAIIVGCAVLLAFLVWFLWPWASLVRNWSRLAAARRTASPQGVSPAPGAAALVIDVEPSPPAAARPGFTRVELVVMVAGFLLLTFLGVRHMVRADDSHGETATDTVEAAQNGLQEMLSKRSEAAAQLHSDYVAALNRHYADFLSKVDSTADERFDSVRARVPGVAERFGTFSRCKGLLIDLVYDKFDNGSRASEGIRRDLESDFYRGLYGARDAVNACLVDFLEKAEAERQAFSLKLAVELNSVELPGDEAFIAMLADGGERIEESKRRLSEGQIDAAISVVAEAACIRFTVSTASRILGRAAARMAGSATFGGGAALCDGPLPVGDIIGGVVVVGSTAWCAYDIYKASDALPGELREALYSVVNDCKAKTVGEYRKAGKELLNVYSLSNAAL